MILKAGTMLQDRYEILEKIGSGGMSDVYKAKCHKLNRLVAIKVLKAEFTDDANFVSKFKMEAQAAAGLSHPNIVSIYDVVDEGVHVGNCLPLSEIPVGTMVHNVELYAGHGGQMVRSAGNGAQVMAKEGKYATLRLPSGEMRMVPLNCRATIGIVGNAEHSLVNIGKAGRKRHMGIRPTVRGSVMNPNDHPHGGGEGRAPIGRPAPCTPWGKPALGLKTRKKNKSSNKLIVRRRDGKALK